MTVKRKAAVRATLVSIAVPYAERLPAHRRTAWWPAGRCPARDPAPARSAWPSVSGTP